MDETGQDSASTAFVVVTVVSDEEQEPLREKITRLEAEAKTGALVNGTNAVLSEAAAFCNSSWTS